MLLDTLFGLFVFICRFHSNPDNSCSYLTDNFKSRCLQIFNYHRLLSWDNTRGLHVDIFKVSQIAQQNIRTPSTETINIAHRLGANMLFLSHRRLSRRIPTDQHIPRRQWAQWLPRRLLIRLQYQQKQILDHFWWRRWFRRLRFGGQGLGRLSILEWLPKGAI